MNVQRDGDGELTGRLRSGLGRKEGRSLTTFPILRLRFTTTWRETISLRAAEGEVMIYLPTSSLARPPPSL